MSVLLVGLVVLMPLRSESADLDTTVAIKFQYKFGEPVQKSQIRMGLFIVGREVSELAGLGLLELRLSFLKGHSYAVLDQDVEGGMGHA